MDHVFGEYFDIFNFVIMKCIELRNLYEDNFFIAKDSYQGNIDNNNLEIKTILIFINRKQITNDNKIQDFDKIIANSIPISFDCFKILYNDCNHVIVVSSSFECDLPDDTEKPILFKCFLNLLPIKE